MIDGNNKKVETIAVSTDIEVTEKLKLLSYVTKILLAKGSASAPSSIFDCGLESIAAARLYEEYRGILYRRGVARYANGA